MRIDVSTSGLTEVMRRFSDFYSPATEQAVGDTVETYARKMASDASDNAPVLDGFLKGSLASSPEKVSTTEWTFGSDLPYARRQEYEHATKKGFVRKSVWTNRTAYRAAVRRRIVEGR